MITPKITNLGYSNLWTDMSTILGYASNFDQQIQKLFANGEQGFFYDPNDLSTMFQDAAGTIPVAAVGQPVGLIRDKSGRNNHAYQTTSASRPILRQNATTGAYYLELDGVDDHLQVDNLALPSPMTTMFAVEKLFGVGVIFSPGAAGYFSISPNDAGSGAIKLINRKTPKDVDSFRFVGGDLIIRSSVEEGTQTKNNSFATLATKYIGMYLPTGNLKFNGNIYGAMAIAKNMPVNEEDMFRDLFNKRLG